MAAEAEQITGTAEGQRRLAQLRQAAKSLRTRAPTADVDRLVLIVGAVLFPMGIMLIIMGWWGASHTPFLFEQVPYLISGGLVGLGFVLVGGFAYFGYWLTTLIREARQQSEQQVALLTRIESLLASGGVAASAAPPAAPSKASSTASSKDGAVLAAATSNGTLVATAKGSMVHRPDCTIVAGKRGLKRVRASDDGYEPCKLCSPLDQPA